MKIICDKCEYIIDRDKYINGQIVEEYKNIFGTICPNCKNTIPSLRKPFFDEKKQMKVEILREEMRTKLRKKIKGEKKCL